MEDRIGIGLASGFSQGVLVIQPCIDDRARRGVKSKEQSEAAVELGAAPMGVRPTQRLALSKLRVIRICWYHLEDEITNRSKEFHFGRVSVRDGIRVSCLARGIADRDPPIAERAPEEQTPSVNNQRRCGWRRRALALT